MTKLVLSHDEAQSISEYLKDGESILDCIKRNRQDAIKSLEMLAKERKKVEQLQKKIETALEWCQGNIELQTEVAGFAVQIRNCLDI